MSNNGIPIPGYHEPVRRDRLLNGKSTRSGGCLMYIKDNLIFEHKTDMQEDCFEHLWVKIK